MKQLTTRQTRAKELDAVVGGGLAVFVQVGEALVEIKHEGYYRECGFLTWNDYCAGRLGTTGRNGDRLIANAKVVNQLPEKAQKAIKTQSAAQAAGRLPERTRAAAVQAAAAGNKKGEATAKAINKSAPSKPQMPARKKFPPAKDETGIEVPDETLELWHRAKDLSMDKVRQVQFSVTQLEDMRDSNDIIYTEVQQAFEMNIAKVKAVVADLKQAIPYAVCHTCNGKTPKDCATCSGRGYVSKHYYKTYVPSEVKKLRGEGND